MVPSQRGAIIVLLACLLIAAFGAPSHAAKFRFGADETLHVLADTKLTVESKPLKLCYKTKTHYFVAGLYTESKYVLCAGDDSQRYWQMPVGDQLAQLQRNGQIPSPLPSYERPFFDYVAGYSLWIIIAVLVLILVLSRMKAKSSANKNLIILKAAARRIMARMISSSGATPEAGIVVAERVYLSLFGEILERSQFEEDIRWAGQEAAAFDNYLGAIGRKLDGNSKLILLRAAAFVSLADGALDAGEEAAIYHISQHLGLARKDAEAFVAGLRNQSRPAAQSSVQPS